MKDKIEEGDKVIVVLFGGSVVHGIVSYIPCASGDCWRITETICDTHKRIHYIQNFIEIVKDIYE